MQTHTLKLNKPQFLLLMVSLGDRLDWLNRRIVENLELQNMGCDVSKSATEWERLRRETLNLRELIVATKPEVASAEGR